MLEFVYFLPVTLFALWPRVAARVPRLAVVAGGGSEPNPRAIPLPLSVPTSAPAVAARPETDLVANHDETSLRSSG